MWKVRKSLIWWINTVLDCCLCWMCSTSTWHSLYQYMQWQSMNKSYPSVPPTATVFVIQTCSILCNKILFDLFKGTDFHLRVWFTITHVHDNSSMSILSIHLDYNPCCDFKLRSRLQWVMMCFGLALALCRDALWLLAVPKMYLQLFWDLLRSLRICYDNKLVSALA